MLWGLQALITIIEIMGSFIWIKRFIPQSNIRLLKQVIYAVGIVFVIVLTVFQRSLVMYSRVYLLFCIFVCGMISSIQSNHKGYCFLFMAFYYETIYCLDLFLCIFVGCFINNPNFVYEQQIAFKGERVIIYLITRCIVAGALFWLYSIKDKFGYFLLEKWWYVIPVLEHLSLLGSDIVLSPNQKEMAFFRIKVVLFINLLFIFAMTFYYVYSMRKNISELVEMQKSLYIQGYENITLRRFEKERLFHDMKNHLLVIHGMIQSEQLEPLRDYVDNLYAAYSSTVNYTGKGLVDYLISEKVACAEKSGISVFLDCGTLTQSQTGKEDMDWTSLLGNLWDNAIESCERCKGEKRIKFYMKQSGSIVRICMENSCPVLTQKTGLRTTKNQNGMHGIGMRSIRYVISKYRGSFDWECQGEIFITKIIMYI